MFVVYKFVTHTHTQKLPILPWRKLFLHTETAKRTNECVMYCVNNFSLVSEMKNLPQFHWLPYFNKSQVNICNENHFISFACLWPKFYSLRWPERCCKCAFSNSFWFLFSFLYGFFLLCVCCFWCFFCINLLFLSQLTQMDIVCVRLCRLKLPLEQMPTLMGQHTATKWPTIRKAVSGPMHYR